MKEKQSSRYLNPIIPLLMVNFMGILGFSIVIPFLVYLVERLGGNAIIYSVLAATYSACQMIGAPLLGKWSDVYGRKKMLWISQWGTFFSWCLFMVALFIPQYTLSEVHSEAWGTFLITVPLLLLFVARAFDGLTGGNIAIANAYLADISTNENRQSNFGKLSSSSNLGFVLGPALAGILGQTLWGEALPVLVAMLVSLAGVVCIKYWLPESRPIERTDVGETKNKRPAYSWKQVMQLPHIPFLFGLYFLIFLGFSVYYTAFPLFAAGTLGWEVGRLGVFFAALSLLMIIVQGPLLKRLSHTVTDVHLVLLGGVFLGLNFLMVASRIDWLIYSSVLFFALGNGLMWPSFLSVLSQVAGENMQGAVQGIAGSFGSLASIIGLLLGGVLYGFLNEVTFWVPAGVIFLATLFSLRLGKVKKKAVKVLP